MKQFNWHHGVQSRSFRSGGYSTLIVAAAVAIAILLNLIVAKLPSSVTKTDLTSNQLYSLSDQTKEIVSGLEQDVEVYLIAQEGQENAALVQFLERYDDLSDHLTVKTKDPVVYPNFVSPYTSATVYNNSLLVLCGDRSQYISYYDIYTTSYSSYYSYSTEFAGEGALTSAIDYVTNADLPKVYVLTGHGESDLPSSLVSSIAQENIRTEDLSLLTADAIPDDADAVLIYSPSSDLSESDADKLLTYLKAGGKLLLFTDVTDAEMPNLASVMAEYGLEAQTGVVMEGNAGYYLSYPLYLLPEIGTHTITSPIKSNNYYLLVPYAHGIQTLEDARDTLTITALMTTTEDGYLKSDLANLTTLEREDGDETGAFSIAVAVSETVEAEEASVDTNEEDSGESEEALETQIVWVASTQMFDSQIDAKVAGANSDFFLNCLGWVCDSEHTISIHAKSLDTEYLTVPTATANRLSVLAIAVLPLAVLALGFVLCRGRKRR